MFNRSIAKIGNHGHTMIYDLSVPPEACKNIARDKVDFFKHRLRFARFGEASLGTIRKVYHA